MVHTQLRGKRLIPLVKHSFKKCLIRRRKWNRKKKNTNREKHKRPRTTSTRNDKRPWMKMHYRRKIRLRNKQNTWLLTDDGLCSTKCLFLFNSSKRPPKRQKKTANSKDPSPILLWCVSFASHGNPFCNCL